jgi:UPF0755 protein
VLLCLVLIAALAFAALAALTFRAWRTLHEPYQGYEGDEKIFVVRPGVDAGTILEELEQAGLLADARLARHYLVYVLEDPPLQAGEYLFSGPANTLEVLDPLIAGRVVTYPVTLVEGLTLEETAHHLAANGFGELAALNREMTIAERISDLDPQAVDLEGYLFPDTYSFAKGTGEAEIIDTLVRTFRRRYSTSVAPLLDPDGTRTPRQVVTLASLVEKEAAVDEERPVIAGVYVNRLQRGMALYADPTVIYALKQLGRWDGNLRRPDLKVDSPYNTYVYPGLPPGPIASPGLASLQAAARPAEVSYLYFVSRNDGTHVFAETLAEHNRNVNRWQREYWRQRWREERQKKPG